ncbi:MAG: protein tyrosine phosphatase [Variovorax sp.]|nr:MAG: protein tyrosine phosphatase [Variovorax sp.]
MAAKRFVVIFVSRRNSLRSILAQACLNHLDADRFSAYSCGQPGFISDAIHPAAIGALRSASIAVPLVQPHGWNDLARAGGHRANFIITLDEATQSAEPRWPGQPDSALWALPDVAGLDDPEESARAAIQLLYMLRRRLELLTSLPLREADPAAIRSDVRDLAHMQ